MSKALEDALLKSLPSLAPQDELRAGFNPIAPSTGFYTADTLAKMEASHLRLIEAAVNAMAYLNPNLYAHGALKRAVKQAEEIRAKAGLQ